MRLYEIKKISEDSDLDLGLGTNQGTRIKREDIPGTIKYISDLLAIPRGELHPLGSVGKIADSGDIDLGVDINKYNPEHLDKVMKAHGYTGSYDKERKVATYTIPVKGDPSKGRVQLDLMYTTNPDWAKFSYYSAGEGSRYKGIVRTVLLTSVAAIVNEPGTDYLEYTDKGDVSARVGRTMDLHAGIRRVHQYRPKLEAGDGYEKSMKTVSPEDFIKMHPGVNVKNGQMLVDAPDKAMKILFGKGVTPEEAQSAEQVLHLIKTKFTPDQQKRIFKISAAKLKDQVGKTRLPPEIEEYLGK